MENKAEILQSIQHREYGNRNYEVKRWGDSMKWFNTHPLRLSEGEHNENEGELIFERIIASNISEMMKIMNL